MDGARWKKGSGLLGGSILAWTPLQRLPLWYLPPPCFQLWIIPSILGSSNLYFLSDDHWETVSAWVYGLGLCGLFVVSTVFHTISWKKSHLRYLRHSRGRGRVRGWVAAGRGGTPGLCLAEPGGAGTECTAPSLPPWLAGLVRDAPSSADEQAPRSQGPHEGPE